MKLKPAPKKNIEIVALEGLKYHPRNPRIHDEKNIRAIMRSISDFRQITPLIVWGKQNYVIAGNGRLEALRRLGRVEAKIIRADYLSEAQALSYMVADNKTTDLSEFDPEQIAEIMGEVAKKGFDPSSTGSAVERVEPLIRDNSCSEDDRFSISFTGEPARRAAQLLEENRGPGELDADVAIRALEDL
jgi:ParB-like chromosome segregation protein Spo0J